MTPDEIRVLNFKDLMAVYWEGTAAYWGARLAESPPLRAVALRLGGPFDRLLGEASPREAIRGLLRFYGLMEIASLASVVPKSLPVEFAAAAQEQLSDPLMRQFYERDVPMVLPQVFRSRLEGGQELREEPSDIARQLFQHLLGLYGAASADDDVAAFLAAAHGADDRRVRDLFRSLESQGVFLYRLLDPQSAQGDGSPILHGFRKLVLYCIDMRRVFSESRDLPLFAVAVRWFNVDWLSGHAGLRRIVWDALLRIRRWQPSQGGEEADRARAAFDRMENAVVDVLSQPDVPFAWLHLVQRNRPADWGQAGRPGVGL